MENSWLTAERTIIRSRKAYAHFDRRCNISSCAAYISDPAKVAVHAFYPFIHYEKDYTKYSASGGKKPKTRDICYAAHIDRCIYQYYSHLLNELYNERVENEGIARAAVAYRTNLHENNIKLAKRAISFIRSHAASYVMIGDFTKFFDNLDHKYLKRQWCSVLNVGTLPSDHYKVFRSVTHFSIWERSDLLHINGLENTNSGIKKLNKLSRVLTPEQFQANKSHITVNKKPFGIPQGSPISATLANIYMLDADKYISDLVSEYAGLYMRYSDDFIIVLPDVSEDAATETLSMVTSYFNSIPGLALEPSKTQYFSCTGKTVSNCGARFNSNADCSNNEINFLGFSFDGNKVHIRAKTTSKYYYRMYRKAKTIAANGGYTSSGKRISGKNLYKQYSQRGANAGNYFTYLNNAVAVFGDDENIMRDTKRHMAKIKRACKKQ